ncbi:MAG: hypothetical protein QGH66_03100 [Dehalococcoidia bacterium]|jgi:hypothetical protein|nr:hypothetical protein [Dehalococcoidia bacterium]
MTEPLPGFRQPPEPDALVSFRASLRAGTHWYQALLEAIALWDQHEEVVDDGRHYRYLVGGEAFDWLLLAERLCDGVGGLTPSDEVDALLFQGRPPVEMDRHRFRYMIGLAKHQAYLNFFYGVVVEEALSEAVEEEVRKSRWCTGLLEEPGLLDEAFQRIYGASHATLLESFRRERSYPQEPSTGLDEMKEFTYWRFKYRLKHSEPDKVASDTRKGLLYLHRQRVGLPT